MKSFIIFALFVIKAAPCYAHDSNGEIIWHSKKLTWDDFRQDYSKVNNLGHSSKVRWELHCDLIHSSDSGNSKKIAQIWAGFVPKSSWVKPTAIGNEYLLNHEQLHFDLVEFIRKEITKIIRRN